MSQGQLISLIQEIPAHLLEDTFKELTDADLVTLCSLGDKSTRQVCTRPELYGFWRRKLRECGVDYQYSPCDETCFETWLRDCAQPSLKSAVNYFSSPGAYWPGRVAARKASTSFTLDINRVSDAYLEPFQELFPDVPDVRTLMSNPLLIIYPTENLPQLKLELDVPQADQQRIEIAVNAQDPGNRVLMYDVPNAVLDQVRTLTVDQTLDLLTNALKGTASPQGAIDKTLMQLYKLDARTRGPGERMPLFIY